MEIKIGDNDMTDQNNKLVIFQNKHKRNSQILLNKSLNHFGTQQGRYVVEAYHKLLVS